MFKKIKAWLWTRKVNRWIKEGKAKPVGLNCLSTPIGIIKHDMGEESVWESPVCDLSYKMSGETEWKCIGVNFTKE